MYGWEQCRLQTKGQSPIKRFFACAPSVLDYRWRVKDFWFHRSYGGLTQKVLKLDGHSPLALLLPAIFVIFLIWGPTLGWRGPGALGLLLVSYLLLYLGARTLGAKYLMEVQLLLFSLLAVVLWFWPGADAALEASARLYRHGLIPLFLLLTGIPLVISKYLARGIFKRLRRKADFAQFLPHVNLFVRPPTAPTVTSGAIVRALVTAPLQYPLHLLFFPSLILLFLPYFVQIRWWALGLVLAAWLLLSFACIHSRFNSMLSLVRRAFFIGGQLVVSTVIIVLAAGRVLEISYVQTVVESSSWATLLSYIAAAYFTFWFLEYWLNRRLLEELVALLQRTGDPVGRATYDIDANEPFSQRTEIELENRIVQAHGGARLMAIGTLKEPKNGTVEAFQPYEKRALFDRLIEKASWSRLVGGQARSESIREHLEALHRRVRFYFSFANLLLIAVSTAGAIWLLHLPQQPVAVVASSPEGSEVDLAGLIWSHPPRDDVILLAASGGGTRAAIYTQSVLHGLHTIGALDKLVLASGVSGGGAALAYFAVRRHDLGSDPTGAVWDEFSCDMSYPFIWDVLEGVSEWRILAGTRSGALLAESFCRVFYHDCPQLGGQRAGGKGGPRPGIRGIGELEDLGLILNTALAGQLNCPECATEPDFTRAVATKERRQQTDGSVAGSRLIFTNLRDSSPFPNEKSDLRLQYVVVRDPKMLLPKAAALNANFPPVFSNAPVDLDRTDRYWVTDGGATDNRGLISLLLALREALHRLPAGAASLPDIHVVMAEASAGSKAYSIQDRGVGTKFGAPGKIASQLIGELLTEVTSRYDAQGGRVLFHDLAMPEFLRIDGGLGTHWMLPRAVKMKSPDAGTRQIVRLDSFAVRHLIRQLHHPTTSDQIPLCDGEALGWFGRRLRANLPTVQRWATQSGHQSVWNALQAELR